MCSGPPLTFWGQGEEYERRCLNAQSAPLSFQAGHQPVVPHHLSDIGRYIPAEGRKRFPPALEAGVGSKILNTAKIKEAAGLQLSLGTPHPCLGCSRGGQTRGL